MRPLLLAFVPGGFYAVKEVIIDDWLATQKKMMKTIRRWSTICPWISDGRALGNNLINMTAYTEVKEALDEMGIDLNAIEDEERIRLLKRRPWPSGGLLPGFAGNPWLCGIWLWHTLSLRNV